MKKTFFLFLISSLLANTAVAQSANDLFERIDPYRTPPAAQAQQQAPAYPGYQQPQTGYQAPTYGGYPSPQPQTAPAYPSYQQPQAGYQAPSYGGYPSQQPQAAPAYPGYQQPTPINPDALKVFGNGFENFYPGQMQQQAPAYEQPAWQDPGTIDPGKIEKNYEARLKEGMEKPIPKRTTTIGDDRIDELRNRVNALAVPKAK